MGRLVRTGAVVSMCAGGDVRRPLVAVVTGRSLADVAGDRLQVWDVVSGQVVAVPVEAARCVALGVSADEKVVVTGHADGVVRVWALPDLTLRRAWHAGAQSIDDVQLAGSAGEAIVVTLGADDVVARWSLETGGSLGALDAPPSLAISAERLVCGRHVVVTAGHGLSLWDAHDGERLPLPVPEQESLGDIAAVVLSIREGRDLLTVVTGRRELVMFDLATGARVGEQIDAHVDDFSQYGGHVWGGRRGRPRLAMVGGVLAVPTRWRVHLWDLPTSAPAQLPLSGPVRRPVLASVRWEGRDWLLTGSAEDGMVGLWDLDPPARRLAGHQEQVNCVGLAEPEVVVSVDDGGMIAARRTGDGSLVARPTHTNVRGVVSLVAWADGRSVRAATGAGLMRSSHPWLQRWDLVMREEVPPPIKLGVPQVRHLGMAAVRGEKVLVVIDRKRLQLRRASDGVLLDEVHMDRGTFRLVTGPSEGGSIAVVSAIDHSPEVFRLEALVAPSSPVPGLHGGFAAALDGTRLIAGSLAERRSGWRTVWAYDLSGHALGPDIVGLPITSVAIATWPAAFIARIDGTVSLTDLESGHDLCPALQLPAEARSIATADDGDLLVGLGTHMARFKPPIQTRF